MKERRPLVAGLNPESNVDRSLEEQFVFAEKKKPSETHSPATASEVREGKGQTGNSVSRVPLTTRVRADYSAALKRASLQRQLDGAFPNTLQDILEEALEPWLRSNGYMN